MTPETEKTEPPSRAETKENIGLNYRTIAIEGREVCAA